VPSRVPREVRRGGRRTLRACARAALVVLCMGWAVWSRPQVPAVHRQLWRHAAQLPCRRLRAGRARPSRRTLSCLGPRDGRCRAASPSASAPWRERSHGAIDHTLQAPSHFRASSARHRVRAWAPAESRGRWGRGLTNCKAEPQAHVLSSEWRSKAKRTHEYGIGNVCPRLSATPW
jgi:hypothetical protein